MNVEQVMLNFKHLNKALRTKTVYVKKISKERLDRLQKLGFKVVIR